MLIHNLEVKIWITLNRVEEISTTAQISTTIEVEATTHIQIVEEEEEEATIVVKQALGCLPNL